MLSRLRRALALFFALAVGYALAGGPAAVFLHDVWKMTEVEWARYHVNRGAGGNFPLLIAGFFLGQGIFLFTRRFIRTLAPTRTRHAEQIASWDPGLLLASRFGVQRFLTSCAKWASEDPSTRTQSLALFKISGLGLLNEDRGTLVTTDLLRRIATELRAAALPETASSWQRWSARYAPRRPAMRLGGVPAARCAGRWSGATFALAFRELQPHQVIAIAQDVAGWIRGEFAALGEAPLGLSVGIGIGSPRPSARGVEKSAAAALATAEEDMTAVAHDPTDARSAILSQIAGVRHVDFTPDLEHVHGGPRTDGDTTQREVLVSWLKSWGPAVGCLAVTPLILLFKLPSGPLGPAQFPWPDQLKEIPVLGPNGASNVRLLRSTLSTEDSGAWKVSGGKLIQPEPGFQLLRLCEVEVTVTNLSDSSRYVSAADFALRDGTGWEGGIETLRQVRLAGGLTGKWLAPGESWSGWVLRERGVVPITGVVFRPDGATRMVMKALK